LSKEASANSISKASRSTSDARVALRNRIGSTSVRPSPSRDIHAAKPRTAVSARRHAVVGW
jgi:hypothetical protein